MIVELAQNSESVIITIEDTGPGIKAEDQERIFHPFEQARNSSLAGGTGLGLAISKKIVANMGENCR